MHTPPSALQAHPQTNMRIRSRSLLSLLTIGVSKSTNLHRKIAYQFVEPHLSNYAIHHSPPNIPFIIAHPAPLLIPSFPPKKTPPRTQGNSRQKKTPTVMQARSPPTQSNSQSTKTPQKSTKRPPDSKP